MRETRKRADGSAIDSMKNLAEFVQSFPASAQPEVEKVVEASASQETAPPPEVPATPAPIPVTDPEFGGKSPEEIIAIAKAERERAASIEREARQARAELEAERTKKQVEDAARRVLAEQQRPARIEQQPAEDPRIAQVNEFWFTDPPKAQALLREIAADERKRELETIREQTKKEVFTELSTKQRKEQGEFAYHSAVQQLQQLGVPPSQFDANRITAIYAAITREPTATAPNQYYVAGGPLNANVIVQAWKDLYGIPNQTPAPSPYVPTPTPPVPPAVPVVAPPGSGKPAPAAVPKSTESSVRIDAQTKKEYEHLAEVFGYDKEKFLNRRRARLERERGN